MGIAGSRTSDTRRAPPSALNTSNSLCLLLSTPSPASESVWNCIGSSPGLRGKLCLVCRGSREAVYQKIVSVNDNEAPINVEFLQSVLTDAPHLQSLTIRKRLLNIGMFPKQLQSKLMLGSRSLRFLDLTDQYVSNLRFLEKIPFLEHLILTNRQTSKEHIQTKLSSELRSLRYLDMSNQKVTDLHFLEKLPNLEHLLLRNVQVKQASYFYQKLISKQHHMNISPIGTLKSLRVLFLSSELNIDLTPLSRCQCLKKLFIAPGTRIDDISPLSNCKSLRILGFFGAASIKNFDALASLTQLRILLLFSANQLRHLRWISSCKKLHTFALVRANLSCDATELSSLPNLRLLMLQDTGIKDISALQNSENLKVVTVLPLLHSQLTSSFNNLSSARPDMNVLSSALEIKLEAHFDNDNDAAWLIGSGSLAFTSSIT